jgi:hypothetical protein
MKSALKALLLLCAAFIIGLVFGILPCYLFPVFGCDSRIWCGFKSEPMYFFEQFWIGAVLTIGLGGYALFFRKRLLRHPERQ